MNTILATVVVFLAALLAAMQLGGSLYEALVVYPAWSASPPASLALLQGANAVDSSRFWILVHVSFEIALLTALALNWRAGRRRTLLLVGLSIHVLMRVWTFLYFVPEITQFMATPPNGPFSPELAARVSLWGELGWIRRALIAASSVLLLLALLLPPGKDGPTIRSVSPSTVRKALPRLAIPEPSRPLATADLDNNGVAAGVENDVGRGPGG